MKARTYSTARTAIAAALALPIAARAQETAASCASPSPGVIPSCNATERLQDLSATLSEFAVPASTVIATTSGNGIEGNATRNWSLTNQGSITGVTGGVSLSAQNDGGASFVNFGIVVGGDSPGVSLAKGGTLINHENGSITSAHDAVSLSRFGAVINDGLIHGSTTGATNTSVYFGQDGDFVQSATGEIAGVHGVQFNVGRLSGSNAGSISVSGNGLLVRTGSAGIFENTGTIATTGHHASSMGAIRVQGGASLTLTGSGSVRATGNGAFGIYASDAGTKVSTSGVQLTSETGGGTGVYAATGAAITLNHGSVTTSTAGARGLDAYSQGSSITANNVAIATSGDGSDAVSSRDGGTLELNGGTLVTTSGANSAGASVSGPGEIVIANSTISTAGVDAPALNASPFGEVGGGGATIGDSTLDSAQGAGIVVNDTVFDAAFNRSELSGGAALSWTTGSGILHLSAAASVLTGAALTEAGSETHYSLRESTNWNLAGDSTLTSLALDDAIVKYAGAYGLAGAITLDSGGGSFDTSGFDTLLAQPFSGPGALTKLGAGTLTLTSNSAHAGGTTINGGTLQLGDGGTVGNIDGPIVVNGTLAYFRSDSPLDIRSALAGSGSVRFRGVGASGASSYRVTSIDTAFTGGFVVESDARFQVDGAGDLENASITVANNATLFVSTADTLESPLFLSGEGWLDGGAGRLGALRMSANAHVSGPVTLTGDTRVMLYSAGDRGTISGPISDSGNGYTLEKRGDGTLVLTGTLDVGTTAVNVGTLQVGDGSGTGSITGAIVNDAALVFNRSDEFTHGAAISGSGAVTQAGSGSLTLSGASNYTGLTTVASGRLRIDGSIGSDVQVNPAATLGGAGLASGTVTLGDASHLAPGNSVGTLRTGGLLMNAGTQLDYEFGLANRPGGVSNDLTVVNGDLTLDGVLNIADVAGFGAREVSGPAAYGAAVYRLFDYGGSLTDRGLEIGSMPAGFSSGNVTIDTATPGQVNLTVLTGGAVQFWDGQDLSPDGEVNGGSAIWAPSISDWTNSAGVYNGDWQGGLAVFEGAPGTVALGADIPFAGMLFATDGYRIVSADFSLQATAPDALVRVAGGTATIDAPIVGSTRLLKTGAGVLALGGANDFSEGTRINGGAIEVASDGALGVEGAALGLDNGTLMTSQSFASTRAVSLGIDGGTFDTAAGTGLTLSGAINGAGELRKSGAGKLILGAANGYAGGTIIQAGTLEASNDAAFGLVTSALEFGGGTLMLAASFDPVVARPIRLEAAGGGRIDTQGFETTFAQPVAGAGALTKLGSGVLTLAADNTYAGGTHIEAGTLRIGAGATTGSVPGNVENHGALVFDRSDASVFGGVVSGKGTLEKRGAGVLLLTGDNTYAGGTTISGGALQIGNGGAAGSVTGDITNNGALIFNRADDFAFDGVVSGAGVLAHLGPGVLTLRGANTFAGTTAIATGTLQVGDGGTSGALTGNVVDDGALIFNRGDAVTYSGVVSGTGSVEQAGAGALTFTANHTYTGNTTISAGALQLGNGGSSGSISGDVTNNGALVFDRIDNFAFAGAVAGSGELVKKGAGTLTLNGRSSYTGPTRVDAGKLLVMGTLISDVSIASGATLGGNGTIGALTNAGTVSPGASIGTLHVSGDFSQAPAGTMQVEFDDQGHIDALVVAGATSLGGQVVYLPDSASTFGEDLRYTFVIADGGLSGTFGSVTQDHAGILMETLYTANTVELRIDSVPIIDHIVTPGGEDLVACVASLDAQRAAASGTRAARVMNAMVMMPVAAVPATIHGICPRDPSVLPSAVDSQVNARFGVIANRIAEVQSMEGGAAGILDAYQLREGASFWVRGAYLDGAEDPRDILRTGYDSHSDSFAMGIDVALHDTAVLGAYLVRDDLDLDYRAPVFVGGDSAQLEDRAWSTGLYGSYWSASRWFVQGILEYGWHDVESTRAMAIGSLGASVEGDRDASAFAANVTTGYHFEPGRNWLLQPALALTYHRLADDAYTETGAETLDLTYSSLDADTLRGEAGFTLRRAVATRSSTPDLSSFYVFANFVYDQPLDDRTRTARFAIADPFEIIGDESARDGIHYGVGFENTWHGDTTLQVVIDAENYGEIETLGASLQFRRQF